MEGGVQTGKTHRHHLHSFEMLHHTSPQQQQCNLWILSVCTGMHLTFLLFFFLKQCIHPLQERAGAPDSIEPQLMPLSYKFTLIPATPQLAISLSRTPSRSLLHSLPAAPAHTLSDTRAFQHEALNCGSWGKVWVNVSCLQKKIKLNKIKVAHLVSVITAELAEMFTPICCALTRF